MSFIAPDEFIILYDDNLLYADELAQMREAGVPVGRIVYTFGAANGVPEGDSVSEAALEAIAEAEAAPPPRR